MVEDNNIELETNVETNNIELEGTISEVGPKGEKGDAGIQGPPGISPKVSFEKINKVLKITIEDYEGKHIAYLNDGKDGTGSGDMQKEIYDTDNDGVIDNAQKVNNHIVKSDVPENAKFTDTIYDDTNLKKLISDFKKNIKAEFQNELSNLGSNYLQVIAVEEYEVE
nr:MAG TPA: Pulmonary surfactant-associated protein D, c-type lectin, alpha-helical coiled [Caudoviricetes sp.]